MAVAFDASSSANRANGGGDPFNWTHTPVGTPRGVLVGIARSLNGTGTVSGVTYGGVSMSLVIGPTADNTEHVGSELWFLGSSIPTGAQTVSVDLDTNGSNTMFGAAVTVTASADTEVIDSDQVVSNSLADPSLTLQYSGRTSLALAMLGSGSNNTNTGVSAGTNCTKLGSFDAGNVGYAAVYQTTAGSADFTIAFTVAADDVGMTAAAITQVATNTTATPGVASLTTSTFAPTVTKTNNQLATPSTKALTLATFAPTVTATDPKTATPDTASLTLTGLAPTVTASDHKTATPDTVALTLTTFAPDVTAGTSNNKTATPDTASLTVTGLAPTVTVSDHQTVTPSTKALTTSTFAPTVTTTVNVLVTPGPLGLVLTTYAPDVTGSLLGAARGRSNGPMPAPPPDPDADEAYLTLI